MEKNKIITLVLVAGLAIAFAGICLALYFRGNTPKLVNRKLKIGALLITLTVGAQTMSFAQKTCYKRAVVEDEFDFDAKFLKNDVLKLDIDKGDTLSGNLYARTDSSYVYYLRNEKGDTIKTGDLDPVDGKFDNQDEKFTINLYMVKSGKYTLLLCRRKDLRTMTSFTLHIKNDKIMEKVTCYYY
jgi:hypothetical protein